MNKVFVIFVSLITLIESTHMTNTKRLMPLSVEMIDYVNNHPKSTWKAAPSTHFKTVSDALVRLGVKRVPGYLKRIRQPIKTYSGRVNLPESFDAREQWPDCPTIRQIRDQSSCGCCWAFGATEAMSDRICIHSNSTIKVELSARHLVSCCRTCGDGCRGGDPLAAWDFWMLHGIVSGGSLEDQIGCQPYPFPSCEHLRTGHRPPCDRYFETPNCVRECAAGYNGTFENDKYYGNAYYYVDNDERAIMEELLINGPMEVSFDVYEDYFNYESGIYSHMAGNWAGEHAVKLVGWGVESGTKYWLLANSWNDDWGESGFFRMLRGEDECGIESEAIAGIPRLS